MIHFARSSGTLISNATAPTIVTSSFNPGTSTALLVGKINWKAGGTPDEFFLFNVTDLGTEPSEGSAIASRASDETVLGSPSAQSRACV